MATSDELELVGQEPAHQRHPQVDLDRARELPVVEAGVLEPAEGLRDLREGGPLVLDGLDQEARAVVLDPVLDREDLVGGEVLGGDAEDLVGDLQSSRGSGSMGRFSSLLRPPGPP